MWLWFKMCPDSAMEKRQGTGAVQDAGARTGLNPSRSVLDCASPLALLVLLAIPACSTPKGHRDNVVRTVILRGHVVCAAEELHRAHDAALPTRHEHLWALRAADGLAYTLLRSRFSESIWLDERIRARELEVKARLFPRTQTLEVERIRSVKDGVVQDLYYYCVICHIQSVAPEECACCQGPVELVEKPLGQSSE